MTRDEEIIIRALPCQTWQARDMLVLATGIAAHDAQTRAGLILKRLGREGRVKQDAKTVWHSQGGNAVPGVAFRAFPNTKRAFQGDREPVVARKIPGKRRMVVSDGDGDRMTVVPSDDDDAMILGSSIWKNGEWTALRKVSSFRPAHNG